MQAIWPLLKCTYEEWSEDRVPRHAAALAYYTSFSLAPLLVVLIAIAGFVFGAEAVRGQLDTQIRGLLGEDGARAVQDMVQNASAHPSSGTIATIFSIGALLFGATGVFGELQDSLNTIWDVKPKPGRGLRGLLQDRLLSFGMVLAMAFLLTVSLVVSALLAALGGLVGNHLGMEALWHGVDLVVSVATLSVLFGAMFKFLPDIEIAWRDVWVGAVTTSVLFTIGKMLLGLYLGRTSTLSVYGAAGSLLVLLIWVYYSAQIFFFGAELTQVYAHRSGVRIAPSAHAEHAERAGRVERFRPAAAGRPGTESGDRRT